MMLQLGETVELCVFVGRVGTDGGDVARAGGGSGSGECLVS